MSADAERTHAEFLSVALRTPGHPFIEGSALAGVKPTTREVARWRRGEGSALQAAWAKHPHSRNLPRLAVRP